LKEKIKILIEVTKLKITFFVTITTMFGYIAATNSINAGIILPIIGSLLLSGGNAALNHDPERNTN